MDLTRDDDGVRDSLYLARPSQLLRISTIRSPADPHDDSDVDSSMETDADDEDEDEANTDRVRLYVHADMLQTGRVRARELPQCPHFIRKRNTLFRDWALVEL